MLCLALFFEASARVLLSIDPVFRAVRRRDDDSSLRLEWVKRHRDRQGFAGQYAFDIHHPRLGWAVQPNLRDLPVFEGKILNSNSRGLRGRAEYGERPQPGRRRIVVLGDSFTFGDEVSDDETYPSYLQGLLPDTDVLNLGVHGYGHDQMLLYLEDQGLGYHPDVVILGFVWIDTIRNLFGFSNYLKPRFELVDGTLHLTDVPVPPPEWVLGREVYRSKARDMGVMIFEGLRWKFGWNRLRADRLTRAILAELARTVRQAGAVPIFAYLPVLDEVFNTDPVPTPEERFLQDSCRELQVSCLFLRARLAAAQRDGVPFDRRTHWPPGGHRAAAQGIREHLRQAGLE